MATAVATGRPGPGSLTWRYASDNRAVLLAPTALVLQVAHPVVGAGVVQHSTFQTQPWSRLMRTVRSTNRLVFGRAESAAAESARLRRLHAGIRGVDDAGRPYRALDPDAYAWVHLTLAHAMVQAQRLFARPPRPGELDQFYEEWRQVGRVLGVRDDRMPANWPSFEAYVERMVAATLQPNRAVADVLAAVAHPRRPASVIPEGLWRPAAALAGNLSYRMAVATIPPLLRHRIGLEWTASDQWRFEREVALLRTAFSWTPRPLLTAPVAIPHMARAALRRRR